MPGIYAEIWGSEVWISHKINKYLFCSESKLHTIWKKIVTAVSDLLLKELVGQWPDQIYSYEPFLKIMKYKLSNQILK